MKRLLQIEWLKIKSYNTFIILSSFFALGIFAVNYVTFTVTKQVVEGSDAGRMLVGSYSPYNFDLTWQTTSYMSGWLLLLPALLLMLLMTNEFAFKTHRQNIIDGWSRTEFIHVKMVMALIGAVVATLLVILSALLFGFASGTSFSFDGVSHVGYFFGKALTYNMFALLLSVLIRKTGLAVGVLFIYTGFENLVSLLLDGWSVKLRASNDIDLGSMGNYLPMNAADGLLTFPDNPLKSVSKNAFANDYTWVIALFAVAYLVLYYIWSKKRMVDTDL